MQKELKIQLNAKFPNEYREKDYRKYYVNYRQCETFTREVLSSNGDIYMQYFIEALEPKFISSPSEKLLPLYNYLEIMVSTYHRIVCGRDNLITTNRSEDFLSLALSDVETCSEGSLKLLYESPFDLEMNNLRIRVEYALTQMVHGFMEVLMSGYNDLPSFDHIAVSLQDSFMRKVTLLNDALFKGDKVRWMDLIFDNGQQAKRYVDAVAAKLEKFQKQGVIDDIDVNHLAKLVLSTPQLRIELGRQLSALTLKYTA